MPGLIDYIAAQGSQTLDESPLSAVDGLVFSAMSYIHLDGLIPDNPAQAPTVKEVADTIASLPERERLARVRSLEHQQLLEAMAESARFSGLRLTGFSIHNIPEGISVSVPVFYATGNRKKAFWFSFPKILSKNFCSSFISLLLGF